MSGNSNYRKSGGTNGIGASMVNALSSVFQATVNRDGKQYQLTWKDAVKQGEMTSKSFNYAHTGTTIKFAPNLKYFASAESGIIPLDFMVKLLEERSFLNYGVKTNLIYGEAKHTFYHESLAEFVPYIAKQQNDDILTKRGIIQFTDTKPTKTRTGAEGECSVQVALSFGKKTGNVVRAYTNLIEQKSGGSHVQGFKMSIGRPFIKYINDNSANYLKGKFAKLEVSAADVIDSVIAILAIEHPDPIYGSQDKSTLKNI